MFLFDVQKKQNRCANKIFSRNLLIKQNIWFPDPYNNAEKNILTQKLDFRLNKLTNKKKPK